MSADSASGPAPTTAAMLRRQLDEAPMSRTQVVAVAVTVALSALDGYDVLSVTFAAPAISLDWGIGKAALGAILSSGLAGMALGSFLIAPLADLAGRRRIVMVGLGLMAAGMLLAATAGTLTQLVAWRALTGLGIGTCVAVINPLAAEFANAKRRPLAVALMAVGYPAGGVVGGLLSASLLASYGWRAVFGFGFSAALVLFPVVLLGLPEPLTLLLARRRPDTLARVNQLLVRCGQASLDVLPPVEDPKHRGYAMVFAREQLPVTVRLAAINMLYAAAVFFVLSWLPQIVADLGFTPSLASLISATASIAGIFGGILLGWASRWLGLRQLTTAVMIGLGLAATALGFAPPSVPLLVALAAFAGVCLFGGASGFYAILASAFQPQARASGAGFVIGMGRISSAVGPLVAGRLLQSGLAHGIVAAMFGTLAIVAAVLLIGYRQPADDVP